MSVVIDLNKAHNNVFEILKFSQIKVEQRFKKLYVHSSGKIEGINQEDKKIISDTSGFMRSFNLYTDKNQFFLDHQIKILQLSNGELKIEAIGKIFGGGAALSCGKNKNLNKDDYLNKPNKKLAHNLKDVFSKKNIKRHLACKFLVKLVNPNLIYDKNNSLFAYAIQFINDVDLIEAMLNKGANPNATLNNTSVLYYVCTHLNAENSIKIASLLLHYGADPNFTISHGEDLGQTPFHAVIKALRLPDENESLENLGLFMIEKNANVNAIGIFEGKDKKSEGPLFLNAFWGKKKRVAEAFIKQGFNFTKWHFLSISSAFLVEALKNDWEEMFMTMVEKGANPNENASAYQSAFLMAIISKKKEMCKGMNQHKQTRLHEYSR